jgi:LytR cell envelope-related transcriptional attenuator
MLVAEPSLGGLGIPVLMGRMGRHEPPTNRSFYLSVAASTLRFAIIVALVVGGVVVINQAFDAPSGNGAQIPDDGGVLTGPTGPTGETSQTGPTGETGQPEPSPTITGTTILVFNASGAEGLAGDTQARLVEAFGYEAPLEADTAPELQPTTTVYFRSNADEVEASYLVNNDRILRRLDNVLVRKLRGADDIDESIQLVIYLGLDYAEQAA